MIKHVDVVIIGAGMVGLTLAAALKESGLRIAIIEGQTPCLNITEQTLPDVRVSALNRASEMLLRNLGAWNDTIQQRAAPFTRMEVWEQDSFAHIEFDAQSLAQPNLGHIIENRVTQLALLEQVQQQPNVSFFMPMTCVTLVKGETEAWLTLSNGQSLTAKLIVGADGAHSWLRSQQEIELISQDYGHSVIIAHVRTAEPHRGVARQIFTSHGPLAFLPLLDPYLSSIAWFNEPNRSQMLSQLPEHRFTQLLSAEFDARLGACQLQSEREIYPLTMRYAKHFALDRIALIGDAAHTIHPLAGQGVNLGLLDAAALAQQLQQLVLNGDDIGLRANLRYYERWRKTEAIKMIVAMQGFKTLFEGDNSIKKLLRGFGVNMANQLPMVKEELMKRALGVSGDLPHLALYPINLSPKSLG